MDTKSENQTKIGKGFDLPVSDVIMSLIDEKN
jgi:hypothetical protein